MATKKKRRKVPRFALVDLSRVHDLSDLSVGLHTLLDRVESLLGLMHAHAERMESVLPLISEMHAAQQRRIDAGRKAAATKAAKNGPPSSGAEPPLLIPEEGSDR